ncbi:hypothetical protein SpCBS45565_g02528 [Spizellomyces sp. 'palustris']|nr:hypothetical protein SpCBS45565_g02528 [Spizellomyces sp. 'palustris']
MQREDGHDADSLFTKHSVADVRILHARTSTDIERKKQDLRVMVGERYRDLINTADAIKSMQSHSTTISHNIESLSTMCDARTLKTAVGMRLVRDKDTTLEQKRGMVYSVAAQIKVLVDTPEQIWHAMESHAYLTCTLLYLIAQRIYENLQQSDTALRPMMSFPVIRRQWNAVSHFRAQIIERAQGFLGSFDQDPQNIAETLCAITLLEPTHEPLQSLLTARRHLPHPSHPTHPIQATLTSFTKTVQDVYTLFCKDVFARTVQRVQDTDMTGLYRNMHSIWRYLPGCVQGFRPCVAWGGVDVRGGVRGWVDLMEKETRKSVEGALEHVMSGKELMRIRKGVDEVLEELRDWDVMCTAVVGEAYDLYTRLLHTPFTHTTDRILETHFKRLSSRPTTYTLPPCTNLSTDLWTRGAVDGTTKMADGFEAGLKAILEDMSGLETIRFDKVFQNGMRAYVDGLRFLMNGKGMDDTLGIGRVAKRVAMRLKRMQGDLPCGPKVLEGCLEAFMELYVDCHSVWVTSVCERVREMLVRGIPDEIPHGMDQCQDEDLASQPSTYMLQALWYIHQEWNRVGGVTLEKSVVEYLKQELGRTVQDVYHHTNSVQRAFHIMYLSRLGFPLSMDEPALVDVVDRYHARTCTLFGAFSTNVPALKPVQVRDVPVVTPPRFTLLPVTRGTYRGFA